MRIVIVLVTTVVVSFVILFYSQFRFVDDQQPNSLPTEPSPPVKVRMELSPEERARMEPIKHSPEESARMEADARKKLAFMSLIERLPKGKPSTPTRELSPELKEWRDKRDEGFARQQEHRAELLQALHEKTRKFFLESPGEGSIRRMATPEESLLDDFVWANGAPDDLKQPGKPADFPYSPSETLSSIKGPGEFVGWHERGLDEFFSGGNFGYVKDRSHVAGFKSHGFRRNPWPNWLYGDKPWQIQHVQLVGILTQEKPLVYLTDQLPSMEQVRQGKTRPLDAFEEATLAELREGEDILVASKGDVVRMLGSIRATKTCLQCHDAQVDDLLGAFTYTLRRSPSAK